MAQSTSPAFADNVGIILVEPLSMVSAGQSPAEAYILGTDRWQIELLANLGAVPATGALIVATWPKPLGGSGFPARAFAIVPPGSS